MPQTTLNLELGTLNCYAIIVSEGKMSITVDESKCNGCMVCLEVCPLGNFEEFEGKVRGSDKGIACFACGHCVAMCPTGAMAHSDLAPSLFEELDERTRPTYEQLLQLLKARRSRREFTDQAVPKDIIEKLLAAAVQAPSSINNQSVRYTVVTDREIIKQLSDGSAKFLKQFIHMMKSPLWRTFFKLSAHTQFDSYQELLPIAEILFEYQKAGRDAILYDPPCVIFLHAPKFDAFAPDDAIFNAENILLAAETLGLGACVIGFASEPMNRNPAMKALVGMPKDHKVFCAIVLGYPKFKYRSSVPKNPPIIHYVENTGV